MAKVVAVHGIGQQFKGDAKICGDWLTDMQSGLHLAGGDLAAGDLTCPFYGHLFRPEGSMAVDAHIDPKSLTGEDLELLKLWWEAAHAATPTEVISPKEYENADTLVRWPDFVQRALNALAESPFWSGVGQNLMLGDLKQVTAYMNDSDRRNQIRKLVEERITDDTRVVVGHSLGSVVAYEALCAKPSNVVSFVTIGSPLGIRNVIFEKLKPAPIAGLAGHWPGTVKHWTNIADRGDVVALEKQLATCFGPNVKDLPVNNGADAHHGERYLTTKEAGEAIWEGLRAVPAH